MRILTNIVVVLTLAGLAPTQLRAQYPNIRVSDPSSTDPQEVVVSINPANPQNLAIAANIGYYYYSLDGGQTWAQGTLSSSFGVYGDPCVVFDGAGDLYYAHLSNPDPSDGYWLDRMVVQKSTDGGATWSDGVGVGRNPPKQQDKEWLAVDLTNSPWRNSIYMGWTEFDSLDSYDPADSTRIVFSRSTDHGVTWTDPIRISDAAGSAQDDDTTVEGVVPAIGPNGEVYLSWAVNELIYFDKSTDGGATFGKDVAVTTQPGGWQISIPGIFRCNGWPVTACDVSKSPYRGHIYISWADQRNGIDDTDVFLIKSTDGGNTWHSRVRVNDDPAGNQQFFQWMTVDPLTGFIYLVFYDRRNTTGLATDVFMAVSRDGGASFDNFVVSDGSFTPDATVFFGDYIGIAARGGMVYPAWARMDDRERSVWMAIVDDRGASAPGPRLVLNPSFPNPFNQTTRITFALPEPSEVSLTVVDVSGALVKTLATGGFGAEDHEVQWDGTDASGNRVASGVYFCRLEAFSRTLTQKMVLVR